MPDIPGRAARLADLYTPEEALAIRRCRQEFYQQIITLDDGMVAWRDYLLPRRPEPAVLYYRHQLPLLDHPEKLRHRAIIDVGANIGDSALVLRRYSNGPIYCFEPVAANYSLLQRTLELNGCRNIHAIQQALGRTPGAASICVAGGGSTLCPAQSPEWGWVGRQSRETVTVTTLDDFTRGQNISIGLIKVDIEGFEQEFLAGARNTIAAHRPVLLLSIYHNAADFFDIKPLIESWDLDYGFKISRPPLDVYYGETLLICEPRSP